MPKLVESKTYTRPCNRFPQFVSNDRGKLGPLIRAIRQLVFPPHAGFFLIFYDRLIAKSADRLDGGGEKEKEKRKGKGKTYIFSTITPSLSSCQWKTPKQIQIVTFSFLLCSLSRELFLLFLPIKKHLCLGVTNACTFIH